MAENSPQDRTGVAVSIWVLLGFAALAGILVVLVLLFGDQASGGGERKGSNTEISATLDGRDLRVEVDPVGGALFQDRFAGRRTLASCGSAEAGVATNVELTWPRGQEAVEIELPDDVSEQATSCTLQLVKYPEYRSVVTLK